MLSYMVNVLFLVADALRKDRVGALGGRDLTPNVNDFASDAVRFENAFTTANATDPAVTSIQTGCHPVSHGVLHHGPRVKEEEKAAVENVPQLPEILNEAGYNTAKVGRPLGRWHRSGFDVYPGEMEGYTPKDKTGLNRIEIEISRRLRRVHPRLRDVVAGVYNAATDIISDTEGDKKTDKTVNAFSEFLREANDDWFAFVHLMDTHTPYDADPDMVKENLNRFEYRPRPLGGRNKTPPDFHELVRSGQYDDVRRKFYYGDEPSSAVVEAHYDACVSETDRRFGKIIEALKTVNAVDDTLIVFMADHGESLVEQGIIQYHHGLYENLIRVPLIIRPPGGVKGGRDVDELVSITDLAPTVVEYAGVDGLEPDGYSLKGMIEGDSVWDRDFVMAEDVHQRRRMIRDTTRKYIRVFEGSTVCRKCNVAHAGEEEYYDLHNDPTEEQNAVSDNTDNVAELSAEMDRRISELETHIAHEDNSVTYTDEDVVHERMEALGYK